MEQDMKQSVEGQETAPPCKRKRTLVETQTDRDLETDGKHHFTFLFLFSPSFSPGFGCQIKSHFVNLLSLRFILRMYNKYE